MTKKLFLLFVLATVIFCVNAQKVTGKGSKKCPLVMSTALNDLKEMLRNSREAPDELMKRADDECKRFRNDAVFMDSVAEAFYTVYNNEVFGDRRYEELRKVHPKYKGQSYLNQARIYHSMAWRDGENGWGYVEDFIKIANNYIDSAKLAMPKSPEPYLVKIRLQAPFKHYSLNNGSPFYNIDEELAEVKAKFPKSKPYLDIARYYEEVLAKKEKAMLLDAAEYYEKAGEHNELKAAHWNNFAILVYQYHNSFAKEDYGVEIANKGLERFPKYAPLYRAKLWNEGAYKKWNDVLDTDKKMAKYRKKLKPSYIDYKYVAQAYENLKRYDDAIEAYSKELELIDSDTEKMNTMFSLVSCYNRISQYDKAINLFAEFEALRKKVGKDIEYYHYNQLIRAYLYQGADTMQTKEARIHYFEKADSVCQLAAVASPEYITHINDVRFWTILVGGLSKVKYDGFNGDFTALPEFLEAAERLYKSGEAKEKREDIDYYFIMKGYYWTMMHYLFLDDHDNTLQMADKMLSTDMPLGMELPSLSESRKKEYSQWYEKAEEIWSAFRRKANNTEVDEDENVTIEEGETTITFGEPVIVKDKEVKPESNF